jgi:transcriptional regulator with XRE-family HTH domain
VAKRQKGFATTTEFKPDTLLGKIVYDEMKKRGWSQNELAHRAGLSQPSLRDILTGTTKNPRMGVLQGIARAFGVSEVYLMGREGASARPTSSATALTAQATSFLVDAVETLTARVNNLDQRMASVETLSRHSLELTEQRGRHILREADELTDVLKERGRFLTEQARGLKKKLRGAKNPHRTKRP